MVKGLNHLVNGRVMLAQEKAFQTIRNFTGLDNAFKAHGMIMYGRSISKGGAVVPANFSVGQAIFTVLGLGPSQTTRYYKAVQETYDYDKNYREVRKDLNRMFQNAVLKNDPEHLGQVLAEIKDVLLGVPLTDQDKRRIIRSIVDDTTPNKAKQWVESAGKVSDDNVDYRTFSVLRDING